MINIECQVEPMPISGNLVEAAARAALVHEAVAADITIVLTGDGKLRDLNREYLGIDAATDVLSFPANETDPDTGAAYLGDVVIAVPQAQAQAERAGHPLASELQLLVVHGVLHLLGHDHADPEGKARMWAVQTDVLHRLGLENIAVRE